MQTTIMQLIVLICLTLSTTVNAEVYRWVDETGTVHFSDAMPNVNEALANEQLEITPYILPQLNVIKGQEIASDVLDEEEQTHEANTMKSVVMYSASWCGVCLKAKEYMRARSIPYTEHDIEASERNLERFKALGGRGVPLIMVGQQRMSGFNPVRLERLLRQ